METRRTIRYFLASSELLIGLVVVHAVTAARRTQAKISAQLAAKAMALAEALEASSLNAIRSNALVEDMIAQRLTDNARSIDELVRRPLPPGELDIRPPGSVRWDCAGRPTRRFAREPPPCGPASPQPPTRSPPACR
jgi:hypothetical protein